jgi:hypothetical protein
MDWQASSISIRLWRSHKAWMVSMRAMAPHMCTTITALVRGLIWASMAGRVQTQGLVDVGEDRHCAHGQHGLDGGHEGKRGARSLHPRRRPAGGQTDAQGRRAAGAQVTVGDAEAPGQLCFECFCLPVAVAGSVESIAKQDASVQYVLSTSLRLFIAK